MSLDNFLNRSDYTKFWHPIGGAVIHAQKAWAAEEKINKLAHAVLALVEIVFPLSLLEYGIALWREPSGTAARVEGGSVQAFLPFEKAWEVWAKVKVTRLSSAATNTGCEALISILGKIDSSPIGIVAQYMDEDNLSQKLFDSLRRIHILPAENSNQRLMMTPISEKQIEEILDFPNQPCPFFEGKQVRDTHVASLIFEPVEEITDPRGDLEDIRNQIHEAEGGGKQTRIYPSDERRTSQPAAIITAGKTYEAYLVFMTKKVIPGSRRRSYATQCSMVQSKAEYDLPLAREAMQIALTHELTTRGNQADGEFLFPTDPLTYTRCRCRCSINNIQRIVGGFYSFGLGVHGDCDYDSEDVGAAALRKFPLGRCTLEHGDVGSGH